MKKLLLACVLVAALLGLMATPALASAKTIFVGPSGSNDTAHLQKAFNAAGPGGTVQLTAGHFTINDILVTGFQGTFRGAGKGKTVIGCPSGGVGAETVTNAGFTYLLCFQGGAVTVSDMSFDITSPSPAALWSNADQWGTDLTFLEGVIYFNGQTKATIDRVGFAGYANDATGPGGYNADQSLIVQGAQACEMYGCTCATAEGFWGQLSSDARVTVGGPCQGNVFDTPGIGCGLYDYSDAQAAVCDNQFVCGGSPAIFGDCFFVYTDTVTSASHYLVSGNAMREVPPAVNAIGIADGAGSPGAPTIYATIAANHLSLGTADDPIGCGIGEGNTQDIKCLDNVLSGYVSTEGLALGDDPFGNGYFPVSGWQIVGNDCRRLSAPVADVYLGHGTTHCLVVGGPPPTTVLNNGTDNTLINVTPVTASAAAASASLTGQTRRMLMKGDLP
jgi:hypothetical protein